MSLLESDSECRTLDCTLHWVTLDIVFFTSTTVKDVETADSLWRRPTRFLTLILIESNSQAILQSYTCFFILLETLRDTALHS